MAFAYEAEGISIKGRPTQRQAYQWGDEKHKGGQEDVDAAHLVPSLEYEGSAGADGEREKQNDNEDNVRNPRWDGVVGMEEEDTGRKELSHGEGSCQDGKNQAFSEVIRIGMTIGDPLHPFHSPTQSR